MFTTFLKDSFKYPFHNILDWIKLTILVIIGNLMIVFSLIVINEMLFEKILSYVLIFIIMSILALIFVLGYGIEIIKHSMSKSRTMPDFKVIDIFVFGLKHIVISFVYLIIPILAYMALSQVLGVGDYNFDLTFFSFSKVTVINSTESIMEGPVMPTLNLIVTLIISFAIFLIFKPFEIIGISRLVTTSSFRQAFNLKSVWSEVKCLKKDLVLAILVFFSVFLILGFVLSIFNHFSFGIFLSLFGYAYLIIFYYRFIGLIYTNLEVKNGIGK